MGISPRLATVSQLAIVENVSSRRHHTQDLLGLHDGRIGAQTRVNSVLGVRVDTVLNGLLVGV